MKPQIFGNKNAPFGRQQIAPSGKWGLLFQEKVFCSLLAVGFRQRLEPGQRPFNHLGLNAIGNPEVAGSAEAAAGDQQQVELLGPFTERHVVRLRDRGNR